MKFLITYYLSFSNPNFSEGMISGKRYKLINNGNLFTIGITAGIEKYIVTNSMNKQKWELPLQITKEKGVISLSWNTVIQKNISDVVESLIGACFNTKQSFICSWEFINRINFVEKLSDG